MFSLKITDEAKKNFYESFGRTEESVDDDVTIIKEWMKTQPHLPELMEDVKIKNFLSLNKFSLEKTKEKIDMYYTIRALIPDFFAESNPKSDLIRRVFDQMYMAIFPTLVDGVTRVYLAKGKSPSSMHPFELTNLWYDVYELRLSEDFMIDEILIFDVDSFALNDVKKLTPMYMSKFFAVYKKVYAIRMKKLIIMNCPSFFSVIATILKAVLPPKLFERVEFCPDDSAVKRLFPKKVLPKDYGGEGPSLEEMNEMLKAKLAEHQDRFDKLDAMRVDERLRPEKLSNDDILGYYGSFKKLDVD
ncbi:hypothetical protein Zmor_022617 [Zophobas morio]|nr:hypothetical protein Zmor_022617 [Zophobas morio]